MNRAISEQALKNVLGSKKKFKLQDIGFVIGQALDPEPYTDV